MATITFLGTGGDAFVVGKGIRGAGGIIIEFDNQQFHLDPGPGSLLAAKKAGVDLRKTVGLLVSSGHLHHAGDANAVLSAMSHGGIDPHGVLLAPASALLGTEEITQAISSFHQRCAEKIVDLDMVKKAGVNNVTIEVLPAFHDDPSAVGFKLALGKEVISYTGDTGLTDEVMNAHKGATTLIVCMPHSIDETHQYHLNPSNVIQLCNHVKPKTLVLTHFGHQLHKIGVRTVSRQIAKAVNAHVVVGEDSLRIDPALYH